MKIISIEDEDAVFLKELLETYINEEPLETERVDAFKGIRNQLRIVKKLKCECGFIADLLDNGDCVDDIGDPEDMWYYLFKKEDGTFECPACGAPINPNQE